MISYILQVVLFQVLFLAVYDFFLKKETFHTYNRWYLVGTPIVSFVLPLIKIPTIQQAMPQEFIVLLPEVVLSPQKALEETSLYSESSINYLQVLFWSGVALFAFIFVIKLSKIVQLILKNETINKPFYKLVLLPKQTAAFSFFNFIFLGKNIPKEQQEKIIQHELIHSKQKHSLDLLFFEFLRIVMWFNPMIYVYQQKITLLHEYISDSEMVKTTEKQTYFKNLLCEVFQVKNISFVNQFYKHSFIKKRIIMMTKNKSSELKKLKYVLLLPLLASMLVYTSCEVNEVNELQSSKQLQTRYFEMSKGLQVSQGEKETYLDSYIGTGTPEGKEITDKDLFSEEKEEYDSFYGKFSNALPDNRFMDLVKIKLFRKKNGRATLATIMTFPRKKTITGKADDGNNVPFAVIDEVPVFPGCEGTRKEKVDCLNMKIKQHIAKNFNAGLAADLGLSPGKKRIWVVFRIDEKGAITEINARAPHPTLKEEAMRIVKTLPQMQPGKQKGKAVGMKYTLPISFNIE